jgi:hypothetical protein
MLPHFIIIGAMKSGTSSLFKYLASNPNTVPSSIKEPNFFKSDKSVQRGLNSYPDLFTRIGEFAFEASTSYSKRHKYPGVPERMHALLPEIKLIYLLRDPVKRVISHYVHSYGSRKELKPFSEAISDPKCDYIQTSKYFYQVQAYLDFYTRDQIMIVDSNRLYKDTRNLLSEVSFFLDIPDVYDDDVINQKFHQSSKKHQWTAFERALIKKFNNRLVTKVVKKCFGLFRDSIQVPTLSTMDMEIIAGELAHDASLMREFSGLDFSDWLI